MKKNTQQLILLLTMFAFSSLNAQWLVQSDYVETNIDACNMTGEAWHVTATATTTVTGNSFTVTFPTGVGYASLVEISSLGISTTASVGDNTITINVPDLVLNDVVEFNLFRTASCDAIDYNANGGVFVDNLTIDFNGGSQFTHASNDPTFGDGAYAINSPNVIVTSAVSTPSIVNISDMVTHTIVVENQGQNSTIDNFYVNLDYTDFNLDLASVPAGAVLNGVGDRLDFSSLATLGGDLADGSFDESDSYTFTLQGTVVTCDLEAIYNSGFVCGTATVCNDSAPIAVDTTLDVGFPNIDVTVTSDNQAAYGCSTSFGTYTYTFTNNGTDGATAGSGFASSVEVNLGAFRSNGSGRYLRDENISFPTAIGVQAHLTEVYANGVALPASLVTVDNGRIQVRFYELTDATLAASLGLIDADADGFYDDLPVGNTLTLTARQEVPCEDTGFGQGAARMLFNNQCENNLDIGWAEGGGQLTHTPRNVQIGTVMPSDIEAGEPFDIAFTGGQVTHYVSTYQGCSDEYNELTLTYGQPMDFSNATVYDNNSNTNIVRALTYTVDPTNTIVTIKVPLRANSTSQHAAGITIEGLDFVCGTSGQIEVDYQYNYVCADCTTCDDDFIYYTGSFSFYSHGCGTTACTGVATKKITAARTNLGWTSEASYLAGDAPLTDPTGLNVDVLTEGDRLNIVAPGEFALGTYTDAGVTISYADHHQLAFENGTVTLVDNSTSNTYTGIITGTPTETTNGTTKTIDIPTSSITFTPTLPVGFTFGQGDTLDFDMNYILEDTPNSNIQNILDLRVRHYGVDPATGDYLNCDSYGFPLRTFHFEDYEYRSIESGNGCDIISVGPRVTPIGSISEHFPNEFRPAQRITKLEFDIPVGFEYVTGTARIRYRDETEAINFTSVSIQEPDAIQLALGKVLLEDDGTWPASDYNHGTSCCIGYWVIVDLAPTCEAQTGSYPITFNVEYDSRLYAENAGGSFINKTYSVTGPLAYDAPIIQHNTPATVTTTQETVSWNVNFSNTESYDLDNTWLKITAPSGMTNLESVVQGGTNLTLVEDAGTPNVWYIDTANLPATSTENFTVTATYTSCDIDELIIDMGYSCTAQPTSFQEYEAAGCTLDPFTLQYDPAPSLVQISTITPTPVLTDLCVPVQLDFEVKSGDLAAIYDIFLDVDLAPFNATNNEFPMTYESGSIEVSFDDGTTWLAAGASDPGYIPDGASSASFILDMEAISTAVGGDLDTNGLESGTTLRVRFNVNTTCSHVSGTGPRVTVAANQPCGEPSAGNGSNANAPIITINGVTIPYVTSITMSSESPLNYCPGETSQVSAEITMVGGTSQATDQIDILIPNKLVYAGGDVDVDTNGDGTYDSTITPTVVNNPDGTTTLNFLAVNGVTSGNVFGYSFNVNPGTSDVTCSEIQNVSMSYNLPTTLSCGPTTCPNSFVSAGTGNTDIVLEKATLALTSTATTSNVNGTNEDIVTSVSIENTSTIDLASGALVEAYYDANNDGMYDAGDTLLGSQTISAAITAGATVTDTVSFTATPTQVCSVLLVIRLDENSCICDSAAVPMTPPAVLPSIAGVDIGSCELNDSTQIGTTTPNPQYTYAWAGTTADETSYLDNPFIAQPTFSYNGPEITAVTVITYTVTITRPGGCTSTDTVDVTITPAPDTPLVADATGMDACEGDYISVTFGNTLTANQVIKLYKNSLLTIPANPPNTSGIWTSTELFTTGGSIWAVLEDTVTGCTSAALEIPYTFSVCCMYEVTCPTFAASTVECYSDLPTATTLTEAEFEALGNADGLIGDMPCGIIEITAVNSAAPTCEGDVTRTYTVTEYEDTNSNGVRDTGEDTVLNTQDCTQTITIDTTTTPVVPANGTETVECLVDATQPTAPVVNDACGNALTPVITESADPTCEGDKVYTFTYTDCANNVSVYTYTYTIDTTTAPVVPANGTETVECLVDATQPTAPVVNDACGNALTPVITENADPTCEGDKVYTFTYTDCANNVSVYTYTYTIDTTIAPVVPANGTETVECLADATQPTAPVVNDACGNALIPVITENADPTCEGDKVYTFTYTDCANNVSVYTYTYTIDTTTAPVVPVNGTETVECLADATQPTAPVVNDACGNALTPVITENADPTCEGDKVYTFTYTDCANNVSIYTYTYTIDTTTAPVVPANGTETVECLADATQPTAPVVNDACGNALTPVITENADPTCEGDKVYTFTYTDCANNVSIYTYTYTIDTTTAPVVPANGTETVECLVDATQPTAPVVNDACGNALTPVITENADPTCEGDKVYTFTYTDCANNVSVYTYTYTIDDTTVPTGTAPADITGLECVADVPVADIALITDATDNCGGTVTVTVADTDNGLSGCNGTPLIITRTYTLTDCSGLTTDLVQTITVEDTTAPTGTAPADITGLQCITDVPAGDIALITDEADNCGGTVTVTLEEFNNGASGCNGDPYVVTRTYTLTDCGGLTTDLVQTITVEDTTAPTGTAPADITGLQCIADIPVGNPTTITDEADNCAGNSVTVTVADTDNGGTGCNGDPYVVTRTYTLTDCGGLTTDLVQTITVEDTTAPTATAPADITGLECIADVPAADTNLILDEADNCGDAVTVTVVDTDNGGSGCNGDPYVVTRTYTLTDCGGLTTDLVQTITVEDTTAPTATVPADITGLECIADVPAADVNAIADEADNCGGAVTVTVADTDNGGSGCNGDPYVVTRTYTLTDCGGLTTDLVQTITVEDTTAPTATAPADITGLECIADVPAADVNAIADEADNCGGTVTVTVADTDNGGTGCNGDPYVVTRTYTLTDCGGLTTDLVQTITVEDTTAPTGTNPANITGLECIADIPAANVSLITDEADNCGGAVSVDVVDTNNGGTGCNGDPYIVTRTYTLTDCGGLTTDLVQTITVEDTTAPTATAPADITGLECIADVPAADTNLILDEADNCGNAVTVTVADTDNGGTGCNGDPYVVTRTYTLTDCGGLTTDLVQTITVEDTTAPTATAPADITGLECIADVPVADVSLISNATDTCGNAVTVTVADTDNGGTGCNGDPYVVTRTYTLTDCGGLTTDLVQTITVEDTTAPTGTAPADITGLECVSDVPAADISLITNTTDNCGGNVTVTVVDTDNNGTGCNGDPYVVTRTYTLTDCGGLTTDLVQTITVEDTIAPTGTAPADITGLECVSDVPAADISLITNTTDNCGGNVTVTVVDTDNNGTGCNGDPYVVTRTYTLTDCGGLTTDLVQTITVEDTIAPTGTAPADITGLECIADVPVANPATITDEADNCGGFVNIDVIDTDNGGTGCNGSPLIITRTFTLTDCGGLTTDLVQTITVEDTTAPSFTAPADLSVECDVNVNDLSITGDVTDENDNCATAIQASYTDIVTAGGCPNESVITRTWSLDDGCGNISSQVQTITVTDNTAPFITSGPADVNLTCGSEIPSPDITDIIAFDNCSDTTNLVITHTDLDNGGLGYVSDPRIITRTYTVTDECGNTIDFVQEIVFNDCAVDIALTKEASVDSANVNDQITFLITASNLGNINATNIVLSDILPLGYDYISHTTTAGTYDNATGLWTIASLPTGAIEELEMTVTVLNETEYTNTVSVVSVDQEDSDTSNDTASDSIDVTLSSDCIEIYNEFTPNNDGINEFFTIDCIENYPNNNLKVFNRWGIKVYETNGYLNTWTGNSTGRTTINDSELLPVGTYFYVLDLGNGEEPRSGWLYINR